MGGAGRALAHIGAWIGRTSASAYHSVDPDLRTHPAQLPLMARGQRGTAVPLLPDDGHHPVLVIHGLGGGPDSSLPMRTQFSFHVSPPEPEGSHRDAVGAGS